MQDTIYSLPIAGSYLEKYPEPMKSIRKVLEQLSGDESSALRHARVLIKRNRIPCFYNSIIEICASFVNVPCEKLHISVAIVEECLKMMMDIHPDWDSPKTKSKSKSKSKSQTQSQTQSSQLSSVSSSSSSISLVPETPSQRSALSSRSSSSSSSSQLLPPKKKMKKEDVKKGKNKVKEEEENDDDENEDVEDEKEREDDGIKPNFVGSEFSWLFYNSRLASKFCDLYCAYCLNKCKGNNVPNDSN